MPARKMRVELYDGEGNRYTVGFEGQITREKALRLVEIVELLGGMPSDQPNVSSASTQVEPTKYDRVKEIVLKHFPLVWFSSRDVQAVYEREAKEPVSLSTASTYLTRMTNRLLLQKIGTGNNLKYRIATMDNLDRKSTSPLATEIKHEK